MSTLRIKNLGTVHDVSLNTIPTIAINYSRNNSHSMTIFKVYRFLLWIEWLARIDTKRAMDLLHDNFVEAMLLHCGFNESMLNNDTIITYESNVIKLGFIYKSYYCLIIKN